MMPFDWETKYCERVSHMYGSMTRQLMHLTSDPEVISFAGGLPAWDLFPVKAVKEVVDHILESDGSAA
jgi:DNA-binding transcriptional MocR family regulator